MSGHGYEIEANTHSTYWGHRLKLDTAIRDAIRDLENPNHHEEYHRHMPIREITKERMNAGGSSRSSSPGQGTGPFDRPEILASSNGHNEGSRKKIRTQRQVREEHKEFQETTRSKRDKAGDECLRLSGLGRTKVRI